MIVFFLPPGESISPLTSQAVIQPLLFTRSVDVITHQPHVVSRRRLSDQKYIHIHSVYSLTSLNHLPSAFLASSASLVKKKKTIRNYAIFPML